MLVVTGANGFIGSAMVWELNNAGRSDILCVDPVTLTDRKELLAPLKYSEFQTEKQFLEYIANSKESSKITGIFHMGACSSTTETNEGFLNENNTEYTKKLFNFCTKNNIPFIYASSAATYGDGSLGFDDEMDPTPLQPLNLYGWSKQKFDVWALEQKATPPKWYGLKFFNVYGPNEYHKESMASVVYKAYHQVKDNNKLKLFKSHHEGYEDGKQLRDFVYVKDVTRWMKEIYLNENIDSGVYNVGSGKARSWLDLAENVFANMSVDMNIDWIEIPENIRGQYQYFTEAKMDKLMGQGLSQPQWPLEKGIKDYVINYLMTDNPYLHSS